MHAYDKNGNPVHRVPYSDPRKGLRDTTLRDLKKLGLYPSATEIIKILEKPGLNNWIQDRVLESALTLPRIETETDQEYMKRIKLDSQEISLAARDKGVAIHDAIASAFTGKPVLQEYAELAHSVKADILKELGTITFSEKTFVNLQYGYGGTVDLGNERLIADIKTKEILDIEKNLAWDEHIMQLVAYAYGLKKPDSILVNIFVGWNGDISFFYWYNSADVERGWLMFIKLLELWQLQKKYIPELNF